MKICTKTIIGIFLAGVLYSCGKDDIEIIKNKDTSWEIDDAVKNADIRTKLGYDPRYNYAYIENDIVPLPMTTLGEVPIKGKNTRQVEVKLMKPFDTDVKVSLSYDAALYSSLSEKYTGYELAKETVVTLPEKEKTIAKGETSVMFDINADNISGFDTKYIAPFALKVIDNEGVKLLESKEVLVVDITPMVANIKVEPATVQKRYKIANGTISMTDPTVAVEAIVSTLIGDAISVGLVRDDSLLPKDANLAPAGIEGTLPKVSIQDKENVVLTFDTKDVEKFADDRGYVLPLKWVVYDASGKEYSLGNNTVLVEYKAGSSIPSDGDNIETVYKRPTGVKVVSTSAYEFSSNYAPTHLWKMKDGKTNTGNWWVNTQQTDVYLETRFNNPTKIKGFSIKHSDTQKITGVMQVSASDGDSWYEQGIYFGEVAERDIYIMFKEPIEVSSLRFDNFGEFFDQYINITEIEFYTE